MLQSFNKDSCYVKENYSYINFRQHFRLYSSCNFTLTFAFDNPSHYLSKVFTGQLYHSCWSFYKLQTINTATVITTKQNFHAHNLIYTVIHQVRNYLLQFWTHTENALVSEKCFHEKKQHSL